MGADQEALVRYRRARSYDVYRETCDHLELAQVPEMLAELDCSALLKPE